MRASSIDTWMANHEEKLDAACPARRITKEFRFIRAVGDPAIDGRLLGVGYNTDGELCRIEVVAKDSVIVTQIGHRQALETLIETDNYAGDIEVDSTAVNQFYGEIMEHLP